MYDKSCCRALIYSSLMEVKRDGSKNRAIRWLRVSYWVGAIVDALVFLEMLFPGALKALTGEIDRDISMEFRLAQAFGAPLMIGWAILLLWADRKPLERRGVLVITVIPVVSGLLIRGVVGAATGVFAGPTAVAAIAVPLLVIALFTFSLLMVRAAERSAGRG
jgi:hypothetical protein